MGILGGIFKSRDKPQNATSGSAYRFFIGGSSSGKNVNERSAMQMTAVYSCVRILSEAVASLPLHVYKYNGDGGKEKAVKHPLYFLLHDEPNPEMTSFVFRETLMTHLLLWGNAYAQIIRNGKGEIIALYPLMPNRMTVDRDDKGQLYYQYNTSKTVFTTVLNTIKSVVSGAFNSMWSGIKNTVSKIVESIKTGFNNAVSFIKNLASSAFQWGADIIQGIVNGIKSCIGRVKDAVTNVAETIRSFLHFSVPDEGPLTDYESWMPDFMSGLAKGIEQSKAMVTKAVEGVAGDMVISPQMAAMESRFVTPSESVMTSSGLSGITSAITEALSQMNGQHGDIVIPIYLGGTMLDEVIVDAQQRMNLRSGASCIIQI